MAAGSTSVSLTLPGRRWQVCVAALNVDGAGSESCNWWVTPQDETAPPPDFVRRVSQAAM